MVEINKKACIKCGDEKELDEFYQHKKMVDGHLNKCIQCTKKEVRLRESKLRDNPEWVMRERARNREKNERLGYSKKYKPNSNAKRETIRKYNQKFPEKALARKYTEIYLTKLPEINLHHWSYNQEDWLDVIELSIKEHSFLHRYIIYDQERMQYRTLEGILLDTREMHLKYYGKCKEKYEF